MVSLEAEPGNRMESVAVALREVFPGSNSAGSGKWNEEGAGEGRVTTSLPGGLELVPGDPREQRGTRACQPPQGRARELPCLRHDPDSHPIWGALLLGSVPPTDSKPLRMSLTSSERHVSCARRRRSWLQRMAVRVPHVNAFKCLVSYRVTMLCRRHL